MAVHALLVGWVSRSGKEPPLRRRCGKGSSPSHRASSSAGIQTAADRVIQECLVLVLEPIVESASIPPPTGSDLGGGPGTRSPRSRCPPPVASGS